MGKKKKRSKLFSRTELRGQRQIQKEKREDKRDADPGFLKKSKMSSDLLIHDVSFPAPPQGKAPRRGYRIGGGGGD